MLPNLARLALQQDDTGPIFTNYDLEKLEEEARAAGVRFRPSQKVDTVCAICINEFVPAEKGRERDEHELIVLQNCGDTFHASCLRDYLEHTPTGTCPKCRAAIDPEDRAKLGMPALPPPPPILPYELTLAAIDGDAARVQDLLAAGLDVNWSNPAHGTTALLMASKYGNVAVVAVLISAGANVNGADNVGNTPLTVACTNGYYAVVEALLGADPPVNVNQARRRDGETPLTLASEYKRTAIVRMLLDVRGIDVDKGSHQKWTALMRASWHGNTEIVAALLAANANPNMKNKRGGTALTYATLRNHPEVAAMLREAGAGAGATR